MKVYVLSNGSYSDTHVVGVFSSNTNAQLAARIFRNEPSIDEVDLDPEVDAMRRDEVPWFVRLHRESGNTIDVHREESSYGVFDSSVGEDVNHDLYTTCWAASPEHAVKIAAERRRAFLALPSTETP